MRTCQHTAIPSTPTTTNFGYALKCDNISISYAKTPIQIPIPQASPQLIDIGIYRPSISLSGVIDTVGGDTSNTTSGFQGMSSISYTRAAGYGNAGSTAKTYYVPYKNALEDFVTGKVYSTSAPLELEWGAASYPIFDSGTHATGGAVYEVAVQQCQFSVMPAMEDRWTYNLQFVAKLRNGIAF